MGRDILRWACVIIYYKSNSDSECNDNNIKNRNDDYNDKDINNNCKSNDDNYKII